MDILWPALAIAAIVVFVFYVLAQHWQRVLRQQSWTIRRLFERVQNLEEMSDPEFRRRLGEAAPVPLEQVFTLSFRLGDRFWQDTLCATDEDRKYVREYGSFVGSVKLERWRSHTVATITEVLPDRKATGWQTRSLDFYSDPAKSGESATLWELALARPSLSVERAPSLQLLLRANSLELRGYLPAFVEAASGNGHRAVPGRDDVVFFRVPLDTSQLAEFRSHDPLGGPGNGNGGSGAEEGAAGASPWQAFYSDRNEALGIEWQLRLHDLTKKSEWDRWKILDSGVEPLVAEKK
ncbi:MAG TPA: hypothetical protein VJO53_03530 [Candidatus Acidoferrales bacterium]|nr:hypothetical protein [Candidatus Acidoferrales bacterium]